MPELRKDAITGRWVIVATERSSRPDQFKAPAQQPTEGECPFCAGNEPKTPPEILALRPSGSPANSPGWTVRVVPAKTPFLRIEGTLGRRPQGVYDIMNGIGAHEVVIETPEHIANIADLSPAQIESVLKVYQTRLLDLERDRRLKYVLIFKNYGWAAGGGRVRHTRSQLIATPANPKRVKEELAGAMRYFEFHERCVFCDIIRQETEDGSRLVLDEDGFVVVSPFASRFPFELWVIPRRHSPDYTSLGDGEHLSLAKVLKKVFLKLKKGLKDPPYNYLFHTAPFRRPYSGYWKTIDHDYHWHIEIMPRLTRVAGFEWGTGFYICPVPPEETADFLREVKV